MQTEITFSPTHYFNKLVRQINTHKNLVSFFFQDTVYDFYQLIRNVYPVDHVTAISRNVAHTSAGKKSHPTLVCTFQRAKNLFT